MIRLKYLGLAILLIMPLQVFSEIHTNFDAEMSIEGKYFISDSFLDQGNYFSSLRFDVDFYGDTGDSGIRYKFHPFVRYDSHDEERSKAQVNELFAEYTHLQIDYKVGISTVFWGVTESQHLIDIINQYDLAEHSEKEAKIGQPMASASAIYDWGAVDIFLLMGFVERTFAGEDGRPRSTIIVDTDEPIYVNGANKNTLDLGVRYYNTFGNLDFGLSYFGGVSRDPYFLLAYQGQIIENSISVSQALISDLKLVPVYEDIQQVSIDALYLLNDWAWKLEGYRRFGDNATYYAAVFGFEYTSVGIMDSRIDAGWILEYNYDQRKDSAPFITFQNDFFFGARINWNNQYGTNLVAGVFWDPSLKEEVFKLEFRHRISDNIVIMSDTRVFISDTKLAGNTVYDYLKTLKEAGSNNSIAFIERDSYFQLELVFYF